MRATHSYSSDERDEGRREVVMMAIAGAIAFALVGIVDSLFGGLPWIISSPSVFAVYLGIRELYRSRLWRLRIAGWRMVGVVDLTGTWVGRVTVNQYAGEPLTRFPADGPQWCVLTIHQDLHHMQIELTTEFSSSRSEAATLALGPDGERAELLYNYGAISLDNDNGFAHEGVCRLESTRLPPGTTLDFEPPPATTRPGRALQAIRRLSRTCMGRSPEALALRLKGTYFTNPRHHVGTLDVIRVRWDGRRLSELTPEELPAFITATYADAVGAWPSATPGSNERGTEAERRHG